MSSLAASISSRGGLAATHEIYADGFNRRYLTAAVQAGAVIRVRQGWYALPATPQKLVAAARVGGHVTCLSAVGLHGAWEYPDDVVHIAAPHNACRLRSPRLSTRRLNRDPRIRVHWRAPRSTGNRLLLSPADCLADLIRCQPTEIALTAVESMLHRGLVSQHEWEQILADAPDGISRELAHADGRHESGTESLLAFRMRRYCLKMRPQQIIPGVGRVDFVIGDRLVVEVDGAEHHAGRENFERDRHRDAELSKLNYYSLRFSYHQVMYEWPQVEAAILAAIIRGDHLA